jgi:RNA polymerase sigma-70 factor (ECF subfamily)
MGQDPGAKRESDSADLACGELLNDSQAGLNTQSLGDLLEEYRPYLLAIANQQLPSGLNGKIAPSDLVQHTIIEGFTQFVTFRGTSREELARWLRQILLNHLANTAKAYHRAKREVEREQEADSQLTNLRQLSPSGEAMSREEQALLAAAIERLPESYRQAIQMRHQENLPFAEIGQRLGRSDEAARKLWARAVVRLKEELGIDGPQEESPPRGPADE